MNIGEALGAAAKGAAAGMALGPIGAVAGGVGGLVLDLAPELGKWLFGEATGKTIAEVTQAVETVAGTKDAVAATQAIHEDPSLRLQLRVQLAKIAADRQAEEDAARNAELTARLSDLAGARGMHVAMRDKTVPTMGGLAVAAAYFGSIALFVGLIIHPVLDATVMGLLGVGLGHFWNVAQTVINFYFGSSAGSDRKTEIISGQLQQPATTTTVDAPPAPPVTVTTTPGVVPHAGGDAPVAPSPFPPQAKSIEFEAAFAGVIGVEGGYSDDPHDAGGPTKYGISHRSYPNLDIKNLTLEQAKDIYRKDYWTPLRPDELPGQIAYELFDFAVNSGCGQAVKCLQRLVGSLEDGIVGPDTLSQVNKIAAQMGASALASEYMAERLRFLRSLPTWDRFGRGWTARLETVEHKAEVS